MVVQVVWPAGQEAATHFPLEQVWFEAQWLPQVPQFTGSVLKSVQMALVPLPQAFGVATGQPHLPAVHDWPPGHWVPHTPQLFASRVTSAQ